MSTEEENTDIADKLRNLPKINAGDDFMLKLDKKIAEYENEKIYGRKFSSGESKEGFWQRIFGQRRNSWLIPAMGLTAVAVFALYITQFNSDKIEFFEKSSVVQTDVMSEKSNFEDKKPEENLSAPVNQFSDSLKEDNYKKDNQVEIQYERKVNTDFRDLKDKPVYSRKSAVIQNQELQETNKEAEDLNSIKLKSEESNKASEDGMIPESSDEEFNGGANSTELPEAKSSESKDQKIQSVPEDRTRGESGILKEKKNKNKLDSLNQKNLDSLRKKVIEK